jgi:hypothetical protein
MMNALPNYRSVALHFIARAGDRLVGMGQSKPPAGLAEQRGAGIYLAELNPSRDPAKVNFRLAAAVPPPALAGPNAAGRTAHWLTLNFPPSNLNIIRFYFRRLCATLRVKQER